MTDTPPTPDDSPPATGEESPPIQHREYHCPGCGYDLAGLLDAPMVTCPECARMSSSALLERLGPPPKLWQLVVRLSLPFAIGIGVQAVYGLSSRWLSPYARTELGTALGCYGPPLIGLIALTMSRLYWSGVSMGARPQRYQAITLLLIAAETVVLVITSVLVAILLSLS
ncbi:MAG: hypothetical protein U0638_06950 [Phycisphaerales bacterium]